MTALDEYQRLEAPAVWRTSPEDRQEVFVSVGDTSLIIYTFKDNTDEPLGHWSLGAMERANPGEMPAVYHPAGDPSETLEFGESETMMVAAIERLQAAIEHGPSSGLGGLRRMMLIGLLITAVALGYWYMGASK